MEPRKDDLPKGSKLGRYRIEEPVGRGGMGTVYRTYDESTNRFVALKLLAKGIQEALRTRFLAECEAEAQIRHEHVMPVYDQGWYTDEQPYFVMELVYEPITLDEIIDEIGRGSLAANFPRIKRWSDPAQLIQDVILPVCEGIAVSNRDYAIQHRDLKPENILIDVRTRRAYVIDFGICRDMRKPNEEEGKIVGTPRFLSPEQAQGTSDPRTDVWGLGVLLRYVLTGEPPLRPSSPFRRAEIDQRIAALSEAEEKALDEGAEAKARGYAARRKQLEDPLLRTTDDLMKDAREGVYAPLPEGASAGLVAIIHKAMAAQPAARYENAGELVADLRRWLVGGVVQAHVEQGGRSADWDRLKRLARRHRHRLAAAGAAAVFGLAFGVWKTQQPAPPADYRAADAAAQLDDIERELAAPSASPALQRIRTDLAKQALTAVKERLARGGAPAEVAARADAALAALGPARIRLAGKGQAEDLTGHLPTQALRKAEQDLPVGWWRVRGVAPRPVDLALYMEHAKTKELAAAALPGAWGEGRMTWIPPLGEAPALYAGIHLVTFDEYGAWLDDLHVTERRKHLPTKTPGFREDPSDPGRWIVERDYRQRPVTGIRPSDALAYVAWRTKTDDVAYRLPSAKEWQRLAGAPLLGQPGDDLIFPRSGSNLAGTRTSRSPSDRTALTRRGGFRSPNGIRQIFDGPGELVMTADGLGLKGVGGLLPHTAALERTQPVEAETRLHGPGFRLVTSLN